MKHLLALPWILASAALAWGQDEESREETEPWTPEGFSLPAPGTFDLESVALRIAVLYGRGYDSIARFDLGFAY